MTTYTCPLCNETMERDLILFLGHGEQHVIDEIRKSHPEWASKDGACQECVDYYRKAMGRG